MTKDNNSEPVETVEADPLKTPGFHVVQGKTYCGTYPTKEDAKAFIEQQVKPQNLEAKVIEGPAE